jgi:hypothetical protein
MINMEARATPRDFFIFFHIDRNRYFSGKRSPNSFFN